MRHSVRSVLGRFCFSFLNYLTAVILSEAPRKVVPIEDPERVVEGPRGIVSLAAVSGSSSHNLSFYVPGGKRCSPALRCRAKCNSAPIVCEVDSLGEFPVAVWKKDALSGSFDCAPKILA